MKKDPEYWLSGQEIQNFGDFLSAFFMHRLFYNIGLESAAIRIIGSCIDDGLLEQGENEKTIFWGCGLRHENSLSNKARQYADILAVRGPLSRAALNLVDETPIGDPALLLPAIYTPTVLPELKDKNILVPHFNEKRSDAELLVLSGCDIVLRPNINNHLFSISDFINKITSAKFVLCGALHAAITAAAYGRCFAFWDSEHIDLPFKWQDFSASVAIPCSFQKSIKEAEIYFTQEIVPNISIPPLWPLLMAAPFPIFPEVLYKVLAQDIKRHGDFILEKQVTSTVSKKIQNLNYIKTEDLQKITRDLELSHAKIEKLQSEIDHSTEDLQKITRDLELSHAKIKELQSAKNLAITNAKNYLRDLNLCQLRVTEIQAERNAILSSTSWRLTAPLRTIATSFPKTSKILRRFLKLVWWALTLQLMNRYSLWQERNKKNLSWKILHKKTKLNSMNTLKESFMMMHGKEAIFFPLIEEPEVSIIIPVYKGLADLENCLRSIAVNLKNGPTVEVIVIDDCSEEPVLWAIPNSSGLRKLSNSKNLGFLRTCNYGAQVAKGRFLCFLNSDTIVYPNWLSALLETFNDTPNIGLAGSMLLNIDGTIQDAGWRILSNGWGYPLGRNKNARDGYYTYRRAVDCVTGACFLVQRSLFLEMDGLDEHYAPAFYEEFDLAFRMRQRGLKIIYEPRSRVIHLGSASYGEQQRNQLSAINHQKFCQRFKNLLSTQPSETEIEFNLLEIDSRKPSILVIDHGIPRPDRHAGDVTLNNYLSLLASAEWRVIFCPIDGIAEGAPAETLENQGILLIRAPQNLKTWIIENGMHVQEIWLARPEIAQNIIGFLREHSTARLSYYTHDLHHLRLSREANLHNDPAKLAEAEKMKVLELSIFSAVDHITSPSADEAMLIQQLLPGKPVTVLPPYSYNNHQIGSHDAQHFEKLNDIVFVGGFPHTPNVDAALFIVHEIMPLVWKKRPDVRLWLVGYAPPPEVLALAGPQIVVTGQVSDIKPFLDKARVFLAALRYGAGVKGKTVEALRRGIPVVSTAIGVEGIGVIPDREVLIGESPEELADAVLTLLADAERCAKLSAAGAELIRQCFSHNMARQKLDEVFKIFPARSMTQTETRS